MNRKWFLITLILPLITFAQDGLSGSVSLLGIAHNEDTNPFWFYANNYGRLDASTYLLALLETNYSGKFNENNSWEIAASAIAENGEGKNLRVDQLYGRYRYKTAELQVGAWHRPLKMQGLSSVGGDILWSGNTRALPGAEIRFLKPAKIFKWLSINGSLGHYVLNDDRFVKNAQLHYKSFQANIALNSREKLTLGLSHYVQFGGTSPAFGKQPTGLKDLVRIFLGGSGGSQALETDQANALGNHLGSYTINYNIQRKDFELNMYHQTIFEDTSGREFRNFPDGVWGLYLEPARKGLITGLLYEYIQTVSQSGRMSRRFDGTAGSGNDNYFNNGVYRSGWTYGNNVIGLPFFTISQNGTGITNNRVFVQHLGIAGLFYDMSYTLKTSLVRNLGTYRAAIEPPVNAFYSYLAIDYPVFHGIFHVTMGADFSKQSNTNLGFGLGYSLGF